MIEYNDLEIKLLSQEVKRLSPFLFYQFIKDDLEITRKNQLNNNQLIKELLNNKIISFNNGYFEINNIKEVFYGILTRYAESIKINEQLISKKEKTKKEIIKLKEIIKNNKTRISSLEEEYKQYTNQLAKKRKSINKRKETINKLKRKIENVYEEKETIKNNEKTLESIIRKHNNNLTIIEKEENKSYLKRTITFIRDYLNEDITINNKKITFKEVGPFNKELINLTKENKIYRYLIKLKIITRNYYKKLLFNMPLNEKDELFYLNIIKRVNKQLK